MGSRLNKGKIVSVHSFRGGTGKSNVTANLAVLLAKRGLRVAVLDTDLQSPGVNIILGLPKERIVHTLSDFLAGKCDIEDTVYSMGGELGLTGNSGELYLLPSSLKIDAIARILAEGYDAERLNAHFNLLLDLLDLDILFLDTHPGLNRETLLTTSVSDILVILLRPDQQDFAGTAMLAEVAHRLSVPRVLLVLNKIARPLDEDRLHRVVEQSFGFPVAGMLPLTEEMALLGSRHPFVLRYPTHWLSRQLAKVASRLPADGGGNPS